MLSNCAKVTRTFHSQAIPKIGNFSFRFLGKTLDEIQYCKDKDRTKEEDLTEFDFLGYTFKAVHIMCRDGKTRLNFIASVSLNSRVDVLTTPSKCNYAMI